MHLLESEWFFRMVDQKNSKPAERLSGVFSVTEQWLTAPGVQDQIKVPPPTTEHLRGYLTRTAISAKAENPSMLSMQLIILLQGAIAEQLRNPESCALSQAGEAAQAIVLRACQSHKKKRFVRLSATASIVAASFGTILWHVYSPGPTTTFIPTSPLDDTFMHTVVASPGAVNSNMLTATFALQKKIDSGTCPAPHLLNIPPEQVTAYMNVIGFRTPENPMADRSNLDAFLSWYEQTLGRECYYPPIPRAKFALR